MKRPKHLPFCHGKVWSLFTLGASFRESVAELEKQGKGGHPHPTVVSYLGKHSQTNQMSC